MIIGLEEEAIDGCGDGDFEGIHSVRHQHIVVEWLQVRSSGEVRREGPFGASASALAMSFLDNYISISIREERRYYSVCH